MLTLFSRPTKGIENMISVWTHTSDEVGIDSFQRMYSPMNNTKVVAVGDRTFYVKPAFVLIHSQDPK